MWRRDEQRAAHALDQYLQGVRVRAIAAELKINPSTVRRWITLQLKEIAAEERAARVAQLQAAIESQRAILHAAWVGYHREQTLEDQRLADTAATARPDTPSAGSAAQAASAPPTRANHAAQFLRLAGVAQREIARLQGLYTTQPQPATDHVTFTLIEKPLGPNNRPPAGYSPDAPPDAPPDITPDIPAHPILPAGARLPHESRSPRPFPAEGNEVPASERGRADRPDGVRATADAQLAQTAQLAQLAQTAQRSTTAAPASPLSPFSSTTPATPNPPLTRSSRNRLRYLQSLHQQPAHHLWPLAYDGP